MWLISVFFYCSYYIMWVHWIQNIHKSIAFSHVYTVVKALIISKNRMFVYQYFTKNGTKVKVYEYFKHHNFNKVAYHKNALSYCTFQEFVVNMFLYLIFSVFSMRYTVTSISPTKCTFSQFTILLLLHITSSYMFWPFWTIIRENLI
jgi:hypothetical protein